MQCAGRSKLALALLLLAGAWAAPAEATRIETIARPFTGDPIEVLVAFDDAAAEPGEILVELEILGGQQGDLRGILLNLADDSLLPELQVIGLDVTGIEKLDVIDLGQGANLHGGGSPCPCDLGVEFGTPGAGKDDIRATSFVLSHPDGLSLALFQDQLLGVRVTSVEVGSGREGSSKTVALVPEPGSGALLAVALAAVAARRRRARRH